MTSAITSSKTAGTAASLRILVVDDHPLFRKGVQATLEAESDLKVCGEADGLSEAMLKFHETRPQLVITDMSLTNGSGLELIQELVSLDPKIRILVCSMHDDTLFAERALRAGAKGYVNKAEANGNLVTAVRRIAAGHVWVSERMVDWMLCRQVSRVEEHAQSAVATLSDRELEVFEQLGNGMTTKQIAARLDLSPKTIETYRLQIKRKLNLQNGTELMRHAVQWVLENSSRSDS